MNTPSHPCPLASSAASRHLLPLEKDSHPRPYPEGTKTCLASRDALTKKAVIKKKGAGLAPKYRRFRSGGVLLVV